MRELKEPGVVNPAEIPFVRILISFAPGILTGYVCSSVMMLNISAAILLMAFSSLCICNLYYLNLKLYRYKGSISLVIHFFWFIFGFFWCNLNKQSIKENYFARQSYRYFKIRVANEPQYKNGMIRFNALAVKGFKYQKNPQGSRAGTLSQAAVSGYLMVTVKIKHSEPFTLRYGDELFINAKIKEVEGPHNPAEFDYRSWLAAQNIFHQAFLQQTDMLKSGSSGGNQLVGFALKIRARQIGFLRRILTGNDAFALASTFILGYRSDLNPETLNIYADTGTIHALSVSGMHVGMVYLILNWLLGFLNRKQWSAILKMFLILSFIWFFTILTGFSPSALRSAVMLSVFIISSSYFKRVNHYNVIAFSAFGLLLWNPFLIWDAGFQLSFLAVFGLIWIQPMIESWWYLKNGWLQKVWSAVAMSIAAQLITFPLSIYYFHQFPVYFLLSNLFLIIPATLLMYFGITILLFKLDVLGPAFEWLIDFMNTGLLKISEIPGATLSGIWLNKVELIVLYVAVILFILALANYSKYLLLISLALIISLQSLLLQDLFRAVNQKKIIVFRIRSKTVTGILSGLKITLVADEKPIDKDFNYFIKPAIDQHKVGEIKWILLKRN